MATKVGMCEKVSCKEKFSNLTGQVFVGLSDLHKTEITKNSGRTRTRIRPPFNGAAQLGGRFRACWALNIYR